MQRKSFHFDYPNHLTLYFHLFSPTISYKAQNYHVDLAKKFKDIGSDEKKFM